MGSPDGMKNAGKCYFCNSQVWVPEELFEAASRSEQITVYCSYGHALSIFSKVTAEKKAQEAAELQNQLQNLGQAIDLKGLPLDTGTKSLLVLNNCQGDDPQPSLFPDNVIQFKPKKN